MKRGGPEAWAALDAALLAADEREQVVPCRGLWHLFCAEDPDARARAAALCEGCPVIDACAGVAPFVAFGTWAGRDRTPSPPKRKTKQ